jgi:hypothetical protein
MCISSVPSISCWRLCIFHNIYLGLQKGVYWKKITVKEYRNRKKWHIQANAILKQEYFWNCDKSKKQRRSSKLNLDRSLTYFISSCTNKLILCLETIESPLNYVLNIMVLFIWSLKKRYGFYQEILEKNYMWRMHVTFENFIIQVGDNVSFNKKKDNEMELKSRWEISKKISTGSNV